MPAHLVRAATIVAALSAAVLGLSGPAAARMQAKPVEATRAVEAPPIVYRERVLPNGLRVISSVDRTTPNVTIQVWYGVGGKDDPEGRAGFAHLFEHLMFKSTRDMPSETLDRMTEDVGGFNNAFTSDDVTAYYELVPAGHLQRLLWAEAQRMGSLVVDEDVFKSERDVVKEELRLRVLSDPYGRFIRIMIPRETFTTHPYRRPVIGSIEELDAATIDDVLNFHADYYRPDNATLIVVGNFDEAQLDAWVDQYFGPIAKPSTPLKTVTVVEPERTGSRTVTGYAPNVPLPAVAITWQAPAASSEDAAALTVLDAILSSGRSSRLYNSLVYDQQIAQAAFSSASLGAQPGYFYVAAVMAGGVDLDKGQGALLAEVARLRDAPPTEAELAEAKTELTAAAVRQRETIDGRGFVLGSAVIYEGDAARANTGIAEIQAVTPADVQRVARRYLREDRMVVIRYLDESQRPAGEASSEPAPVTPGQSRPFTGKRFTLAPEGERQAPPPIGAAIAPVLPTPVEKTLPNGLRVIVARSSDLPLVTADLTIKAGSISDPAGKAGLAGMATDLLTEGSAGRGADQIAAATEALGADITASSSSEFSSVTLNVMPQNLPAGMALMADTALRPNYAQADLDRVRTQAIDGFQVALKRPGSVAGYVTAPAVWGGTPFGQLTTPKTLGALNIDDLKGFHQTWFRPDNAILVITGDIEPERAFALAEQVFGSWKSPAAALPTTPRISNDGKPRNIVVDMPGAGQAAVVVSRRAISRDDPRYYAGLVANSVLGGGYSARLSQEIRVKRGLAYGAYSSLAIGRTRGGFTASTQTKNETAGEVVVLIRGEMTRLGQAVPGEDEMTARKSVIIGGFGRDLATTEGLAGVLGALAVYGIDLKEIQVFTARIEAVTPQDVRAFAGDIFGPDAASVIVVGDAKLFGEGLKKALPNAEIIPIDQLDLDSPTLRKAPAPK